MFDFLKKKKKEDSFDESSEQEADKDLNKNSGESEKKQESDSKLTGNTSQDLIRLSTEVDRLKAGHEAFQEVRKANTEMFERINEEIGELRSMILERDKTIQTLELKAVKAADLVESVQPDKFMVQLTKQEAKVEALKANIESNEEIMDRVMQELKEIRKKVDFFRGVDEIVKLSNEIKEVLIDIKKVESKVRIEADRVETIYFELRKRIQTLDSFTSDVQEIKENLEQHTKDLDSLKLKVSGLAEKEEVDKVLDKVNEYTRIVGEIKKKSSLSRDLEELKSLVEEVK